MIPSSRIDAYKTKFDVHDLRVIPGVTNNKRFTAVFSYSNNPRRYYTRSFGDPRAVTYIDEKNNEKRRLFRARFEKIKTKDGTLAYKVAGSPASLSYYLLW